MTATTINPDLTMHLGLGNQEPWKVGPTLTDVSVHSSKETLAETIMRRQSISAAAAKFLSYLENREQRGEITRRSNSLIGSSNSSLLKMLLMRRSKSDSYLSLNYKDKISVQKDDMSDFKEPEDPQSSEEPFEQGLKLFACLKTEVGECLQRSERPDISKVLPKLVTLLKYGGGKVKYETTLFVSELLPHLGLDVDAFFIKLMPIVVNNLAHSKDSISKISVESLKAFAETTNYKNSFIENYITFGLLNKNFDVKKASIRAIPRIISEEFTHLDLFHLFQLLVQELKTLESSDLNREEILNALKHIRYIEGPQEFRRYESMLSPKSGNILREISLFDEEEEVEENEDDYSDQEKLTNEPDEGGSYIKPNDENEEDGDDKNETSDEEAKLFDVVPREILDKIANEVSD